MDCSYGGYREVRKALWNLWGRDWEVWLWMWHCSEEIGGDVLNCGVCAEDVDVDCCRDF